MSNPKSYPKTGNVLMLRRFFFIIIFCFLNLPGENLTAQTAPGDTLRPETLPLPTDIPEGTIFVALTGNDLTGTGSLVQPFRSISRALTEADSGDVINCRAGLYAEPEGVRFRRAGITLQSHPEEWAVIQVPHTDENAEIAVYLDANASYSTLRRLEIIGGFYYGVSTETMWDWGNPDDRSGCSHILIEDCRIHDTGRDCIKIKPNCDAITIRRCEIYNSGRQYPPGETDGNAEGIDNVNGDFMLVQDCDVHDIFSTGIYFKGGAIGGVVERCRIDNCGGGGVMVGFDTSPEFFDLAVNPHYYENIFGIVRNCLITNTRYAGIGLYAAKGARILNNTLVNVAKEAHAAIYFGITFQDWDPAAGRPACVDPQIYNNLIVIPEGSAALAVGIRYTEELNGLSALNGMPVMDHNLYFHAQAAARFEDQRADAPLENATFSQWQQHLQNDFHSREGNPLLEANQHPGTSSIAIDGGIAHPLVAYDLEQNRRTGQFDIGAFEMLRETGIFSRKEQSKFFSLRLFPNPANSQVRIFWQNPENQVLELGLYNTLGQQLKVITNGYFGQGLHQIPLQLDDYASGIFFVGIVAQNQREFQKVVHVK
jgi:hypothetical protein